MARHFESLACMAGVEYEIATQTLFIDVAKYRGVKPLDARSWSGRLAIIEIVHAWSKKMPECPVREYRVKGGS